MSKGYKLPKRADNLFESGYCPELDVYPVLGPHEASCYQSLIGVMRWMIEIGQIDINTKVSLLSSHSAMMRQVHLKAALHIMGYLKLSSRSMFDPSYPNIVIFGNVIGQISMWVQWKLSHTMHHC